MIGDMTTVAAVEAYAGIVSSTATDALIQSLITSASSFMTTYMNRNIFQADYVETRNGSGNDMLSMENFPIQSVTSVQLNGNIVPQSTDPRSLGWVFDNSILYYRQGIFYLGAQNVTVRYRAGIASTSGSPPVPVNVPPDLAQVCIDLVTVKYNRRKNLQVQGETLAQQTITYVTGDLTPGAKNALDQWRDLRPVA